ncbi:MAG: PD40 domain-containing protein [Acidobacteria bacterium]|nr:PD40 domain-containing protein [Acidobacteriota bacterium]
MFSKATSMLTFFVIMFGVTTFSLDTSAQTFSISPNGSEIVFSSEKSGHAEFYMMNSDGTQVRQLTFTKDDKRDPAFSPDGKFIVYVSVPHGAKDGQIYVMDYEGKNHRRITNNTFYDTSPSFSPDGSKIVFIRAHRYRPYSMGGHIWDDWDLYSMNVDGTEERRLTQGKYYQLKPPHYSPDNRQIIFAAKPRLIDVEGQIFVMNLDGSTDPKQLTTDLKTIHSDPVFSPDGKKIAFVSNRVSQIGIYDYEVWIMDSDGSNAVQITQNHSSNQNPVFTPDGKRILFLSDKKRNDKKELWQIDIHGKNLKRITKSL